MRLCQLPLQPRLLQCFPASRPSWKCSLPSSTRHFSIPNRLWHGTCRSVHTAWAPWAAPLPVPLQIKDPFLHSGLRFDLRPLLWIILLQTLPLPKGRRALCTSTQQPASRLSASQDWSCPDTAPPCRLEGQPTASCFQEWYGWEIHITAL